MSLISSLLKLFKTEYSIGDYVFDGIIIYLDSTKHHGLVAATRNVPYKLPWSYKETFDITFTNVDGLYAGQMNTNVIISRQIVKNDTYFLYNNESKFAAHSCSIYSDKYSDWYLPSKYELNLIYKYKDLISEVSEEHAGDRIHNDLYWSSTEIDKYNSWIVNFNSGDNYMVTKNENCYVRPVRKF